MGLDMYLFAGVEKIGYWRKHRNLHRLIEQWWNAAGRPGDKGHGFNCVRYALTREQCVEILRLSEDASLPEGEAGFFFGESTPKDNEDTVRIMREALKKIDEGHEIYYDSWW